MVDGDSILQWLPVGACAGCGFGFSMFSIFGVYALGLWYGGQLVADGDMLAGDVLTVFFAVVIGAMGLGQASQLNPDIIKARHAAYHVFKIIDRVPEVDINLDGFQTDTIRGDILFKGVGFRYPSRPDQVVLSGCSFDIQSGTKVAVVSTEVCPNLLLLLLFWGGGQLQLT